MLIKNVFICGSMHLCNHCNKMSGSKIRFITKSTFDYINIDIHRAIYLKTNIGKERERMGTFSLLFYFLNCRYVAAYINIINTCLSVSL